ncbi:MAG TPA: tetratricopeptide repeat protein [Vicinamibacteria bacterium]|nr:tetratricopeptide repeat protein [Vicinamibacteria bacterium]
MTLERAAALRDRGRFDESEGLLVSALQADLEPDQARQARAALADLRFEWSQTLSARGALEGSVRQLEAALEIDRGDRPWQAAEDLNEIGKAWTALGEPERAVNPHREALAIAQSGAVRDAPRPFSCVRSHERTPWVEGDALDGLANAERARGRLPDALALYQHAVTVWNVVGDPTGRSTALTGLGLVRQDLGQFAHAASLHRQALALEAPHPVVRAIILNNLGNAQLGLRQLEAAAVSFYESLRIYRDLEHRAGEGTALHNLGA